MSLRVVADENIRGVEDALRGVAEVTLLPGRAITRAHLSAADALFVRSVTRVDAGLLENTPVAFVGTATSGYDHVDRDWLRSRGIGFAHAPGSNANSVVEYVLAAIAESGDFLERLLAGERLGIVGYGHIGKALAARLGCLGIAHCVYDPWLAPDSIDNPVPLDEVLDCAVISLHPALTREAPYPSHHLLAATQLAGLGARQLLVNASRGPVVDNAALLARLREADCPQVVLDVWEFEPRVDPQLLAAVNLGSAHIAGYSLDGKLLATRMLCAALAAQCSLALPDTAGELAAPPLRLSPMPDRAQAVRSLLAHRYRVADDDRLLREATLGVGAERAARNFDGLRKGYRVRRELAGTTVQLAPGAGSLAGLVRSLGALPSGPGASR